MTNKSLKKIRIENTKDYLGKEIKVFKNDFEIYVHDSCSSEPYYSISLKNSFGGNIVLGGDSAWSDCYDIYTIKSIFNIWNGVLIYQGEIYGYKIEI